VLCLTLYIVYAILLLTCEWALGAYCTEATATSQLNLSMKNHRDLLPLRKPEEAGYPNEGRVNLAGLAIILILCGIAAAFVWMSRL